MMNNNSTTLIDYIDNVFQSNETVLTYFYTQLYRDYNPDINGYNFIFMVPPDLSGWNLSNMHLYSQSDNKSFFSLTGKFMTFSAIDFTPPINQINTERVSSRTGGIPYATEITNTEQCSVTYIDNADIDIYHFHHMWLEYIRAVVDGIVDPSPQYYEENDTSQFYGAIDYAASIYVVRYLPNLKTIRFVGKCVGIFPQSLPTKELIGTRTSNELTTLPMNYFCSAYREATWREQSHWLIHEINQLVQGF